MKKVKKYFGLLKGTYKRVMELPDSPKKIALGIALGTALDFLPMPIISIPVSFLLAKLVRVNAAAAVVAVIFFKWAVPFFFAFNYYVGKAMLGGSPPAAMKHQLSLLELSSWIGWIKNLGYPFLLGSAINALLAGIISYFVAWVILSSRKKSA